MLKVHSRSISVFIHNSDSGSVVTSGEGRNEGSRGAQFPLRRVIIEVPNHCGSDKIAQQCHKYILQHSTFTSERSQFQTWGLLAPSAI